MYCVLCTVSVDHRLHSTFISRLQTLTSPIKYSIGFILYLSTDYRFFILNLSAKYRLHSLVISRPKALFCIYQRTIASFFNYQQVICPIPVSVLQCKATTTMCVHLTKPEECNVKINLIRQFSFSCFGQQDDGDVTYFAASLHIVCEDGKSKEGIMYRP